MHFYPNIFIFILVKIAFRFVLWNRQDTHPWTRWMLQLRVNNILCYTIFFFPFHRSYYHRYPRKWHELCYTYVSGLALFCCFFFVFFCSINLFFIFLIHFIRTFAIVLEPSVFFFLNNKYCCCWMNSNASLIFRFFSIFLSIHYAFVVFIFFYHNLLSHIHFFFSVFFLV